MTLLKRSNKILLSIICAMFILCASFYFSLNSNKKIANAINMSNNSVIDIGNLLIDNYELSKNKFDSSALKNLYQALTGDPNATLSTVDKVIDSKGIDLFNDKIVQSRTITSSSTNNITKGKDIVLSFGGYNNGTSYVNHEWTVVAMSKDRTGDVVVTLWLLNTPSNPASLSKWNNFNVGNYDDPYPVNMYSSSYLRAKGLNVQIDNSTTNKGKVAYVNAKGDTTLTYENQDSNHKFATLTMENVTGSLTSFIDTPSQIKYQEIEDMRGLPASGNWTAIINDCYGTSPINHSEEYYQKVRTKGIYNNWSNDYIWMPGYVETINESVGSANIWMMTQNQRSTGISNVVPYRGCGQNNVEGINSNGGHSYGLPNNQDFAVLPALHLNLTKAENSKANIISTNKITKEYKGLAYTPEELLNLDLVDISGKLTFSSSQITNVGTYSLNVTINDSVDNYYFNNSTNKTETITVEITPKPISVQTLDSVFVNNEGALIKPIELSEDIFDADRGQDTAPTFDIEYKKAGTNSWTRTQPTIAGEYFVRAYITNPTTSNYVLATSGTGECKFTKPKQYVEIPHFANATILPNQITGSTTTCEYTGTEQYFTLVNSTSTATPLKDVVIGVRNGGITYNSTTKQFIVKAVGTYTVVVSLADGGANTQWSSYPEETTKTITLIVTKADLKVDIPNEKITSFQKGDISVIDVNVSGVKNSENVKLDIFYTKTLSGGTAGPKTYVADSDMVLTNDTINVKVDLSTFATNAEYKLYVTLRDNITINDNYRLTNTTKPYTFFVMTATINDSAIVPNWKLTSLVLGTLSATNNMTTPFNNASYKMKLDESILPKGVDITYSNEDNTNAGKYKTTVALRCQNGYAFVSGASVKNFSIDWEIEPIHLDISTLTWLDNPEWDDSDKTVEIIDLPTYIDASSVQYTNNIKKAVANNYVATCKLFSSGNYIFENTSNKSNITISNGGLEATITHNWEIKRKVINVTNAPKQWTKKTLKDSGGIDYIVYEPVFDSSVNTSAVAITYLKGGSFDSATTVADIETETINHSTQTTYYVKIEIASAYATNYEMKNTLNGSSIAYTSFVLGGDKELIDVILPSEDKLMYNGQPRNIVASYMALTFTYNYYQKDVNSSNYTKINSAPIEIGDYRVEIVSDNTNYFVQNSPYYFSIGKIVLSTNGWNSASGKEFASPIITSTATYIDDKGKVALLDITPYYIYKIVKKGDAPSNVCDENNLAFNTTYEVTLGLTSDTTKLNNVEWANDAVLKYEFTTDVDLSSSAINKVIEDPALDVYSNEWNNQDQTITILDWNNLKSIITLTITCSDNSVTIGTIDDTTGTIKFNKIAIYTFKLSLTDDAIANGFAWKWDDGNNLKELKYEITLKYVEIPKINNELTYNGAEQYLFIDNNYDTTFIDVSDATLLSKTNVGGEWTITLTLKDKTNSVWTDRTTDDKTFSWKIVKGTIIGSWKKNDKGVLEFVPDNTNFTQLFTTKYYDEANNEIEIDKMVEGSNYKAVVTLTDNTNCSFENDATEISQTFDFGVEKEPNIIDKAIDFVKNNTFYVAIGVGALFLLLLLLLLAKRRKKKKQQGYNMNGKNKSKEKYEQEIKKQQEEFEKLKRDMQSGNRPYDNSELLRQQNEINRLRMEMLANNLNSNNASSNNGNSNNGGSSYEQAELLMQREELARLKDNIINEGRNNDKEEIRRLKEENDKEEIRKLREENDREEIRKLREELEKQKEEQKFTEKFEKLKEELKSQSQNSSGNRYLEEEILELKNEVSKLAKYQVASEEEKNQNSRLAKVENMLQQFLMSNFKNNPSWVPFNNQDMINYDLNDLMKIYGQAKEVAKNNTQNANLDIKQALKEQAQEFESKVKEYNKQKEDSKYEELLREMREKFDKMEVDNKELKQRLENSNLKQNDNELEKMKEELLRKQGEVESLKAQNERQEKLFEELVKKNEAVTNKSNDNLNTTTNLIVNTGVTNNEKLEFTEAFNYLKDEQREYFSQLRDYALAKPNAKIKPTKYNFIVGVGNTTFIKFVVKYSTLIAVFGTTEIKLENKTAFETAKQMIDNKVKEYLEKK